MATQEELNNQRDLNDGKRDEITLEQELIRILSQRAGISSEVLSDQLNISDVLKDQIKQFDFQNSQRQLLRSITNDINKIAVSNYSISKEELGTSKNLTQLSKDKLTLEKNLTLLLQQQNSIKKDGKEIDIDIANTIKDQIESISKLKADLTDIEKTSKKINENLGVKTFSGLEKIAKEIPILRKFSQPFTDASDAARKQSISNQDPASIKLRKDLTEKSKLDGQRVADLQKIAQSGGKGITPEVLEKMGFSEKEFDGASATGGTSAMLRAKKLLPGAQDDLAKSLKSLNALPKAINPLIAGLKVLSKTLMRAFSGFVILEFISALIQGDKLTGDLAKSMNITYKEANKTRMELMGMAAASGENAVTTKRLQETLVAMQKTLGTNVMMNKENLVFATKMREMSGLTLEDQKGIFEISNATGKTMEDITGDVMSQAKISSRRLGVVLNEKEILKDISKVSSSITLSLGKNPKLIAEAVTTAKALGMELSQIDKIAEGLLQFESSISSELEAEVLLNRDLNLNLARRAALSNDLTTLAKELNREMGTSADFSKMTRIEQSALGKALGMSRDELAQSLFIGEQLKNVTGKQAEEEAKILQRRIDAVGLDKVQEEMKTKSIKDLQKQQSIQDKFNDTLEKLKEIFVALSPAILTIGNALVPILNDVAKFIKVVEPFLGTIGGIVTGAGVGFAAGGPLGAGVGALSGFLTGGATDIYRNFNSVGDLISTSEGKTTISTKEGGLFELSDNDDVIAAPGLVSSKSRKSSQNISDSKIDALINEIRNINQRPIQVVSTITMDGRVIAEQIGRNNNDSLGQSLNVSTYNI
jgi:hypothetical protein